MKDAKEQWTEEVHTGVFKEEAVRMVTEGDRKVAEVSRILGIHENQLHKWKRQYSEDSAGSFPGKGHLKPQDEGNANCKRVS